MTDMLLDRVPPQSPEAEQAVLGAMLLKSEARIEACLLLRADDFFIPRHRSLFDELRQMQEQDEAVDLTTLESRLKSTHSLELVGGREYLLDLTYGVPSASNVRYYAKIVKDKSIRRALAQEGAELIRQSFAEDTPVAETLDGHETRLMQLRLYEGVKGTESIATVANRLMARLDAGEPLRDGLRTGYKPLDDLTKGLHPGELVVLAARPTEGKTSMACCILQNITRGGEHKAALITLEMSSDEIATRLISGASGINLWMLGKEDFTTETIRRIRETVVDLSRGGLYLEDVPHLSIGELRSRARRLKMKYGVELIVVDYLQLVSGIREKGDGRYVEVGSVSRGLKALARELELPVLAVAQLRRPPPGQKPQPPQLQELRESGNLEQDADGVWMLYPKDLLQGWVRLYVRKQRNGPVGCVDLLWRKEFTRFEVPAVPFRDDDKEAATPTKIRGTGIRDGTERDLEQIPF